MKPNLRPILLALLLMTGFTSSGCAKNTYLEIRFTGMGLPPLYAIQAELALTSAGGVTTHSSGRFRLGEAPAPERPFSLPTSAAFKLNDDTGTLDIAASALDMAGEVVATASKTTMIMPDQTWTIVMNLTAP